MRTPSNPVLSSIGYEASADRPPSSCDGRVGHSGVKRPRRRDQVGCRTPWSRRSSPGRARGARADRRSTPAPVPRARPTRTHPQRCSPGDHRHNRRASRTSSVRGRSARQFDLRGRGGRRTPPVPLRRRANGAVGQFPNRQSARCRESRTSGRVTRAGTEARRRPPTQGRWRPLARAARSDSR